MGIWRTLEESRRSNKSRTVLPFRGGCLFIEGTTSSIRFYRRDISSKANRSTRAMNFFLQATCFFRYRFIVRLMLPLSNLNMSK